MPETEKKVLSTYVEPELNEAVQEEARRKQVSVAAVLRWALLDRYATQNQTASKA